MARKSSIEKNNRRAKLADQYRAKRDALREIATDKDATPEERFAAQFKLQKLPRNSAKERTRLRCELTGRPRGNYRKFKLCRIALRDLASTGKIPGMVKSSW